jgi:hypothetical protein
MNGRERIAACFSVRPALILAANDLSVMFFAWMIRDGSNGLR